MLGDAETPLGGVAYVGLGSMGAPQARLLARAGHALAVYDPFAPSLQAFEGLARLAGSPRDAARDAGFACVCVRDDAQVLDVVLGEDGLIAGLPAGALVLVHSTIRIETLHRLQPPLAERGIALVDAPVSRTRRTDDQPFVFTMLGGAAQDCARARALVNAFSTDADHIGPLGAAMALKVANNLVTWVQIAVGVQAAELAMASGVPFAKLRQLMQSNGNLTPTMAAMLEGKLAAGDPAPRRQFLASQAGIGDKDLALAAEIAASLGADTGLMAAARATLGEVMTSDWTRWLANPDAAAEPVHGK